MGFFVFLFFSGVRCYFCVSCNGLFFFPCSIGQTLVHPFHARNISTLSKAACPYPHTSLGKNQPCRRARSFALFED
ncbi:hypothetical protein DL96DRAFT_812958 [Flagelloscypha sp. PMI_526]|nr:hypothetical protein DL96DRAFT_812958 [Flagelloscypha sp. PMI_526]